MVDNAQMLSDALAEIKQLKTKLAALEAQEPVMWAYQYADGTWHDASNTEHSVGMKGLYAAAGAAPAAKVPNGLIEILSEASEILGALDESNAPPSMRYPIVDELQGFAYMLAGAPKEPQK